MENNRERKSNMRKKCSVIMGTILVMTLFFQTFVGAETLQTVSLNEKNQLVYAQDGSALASAFDGMAPGDTRTVAIKVENDNSHSAAFFVSEDTVATLEEGNSNAKGGAYSFGLSVGAAEQTAQSLLSAVAGGYDSNGKARTTGLSDITELNNYQYLAELAPGEATYVFLTLELDGESFDSNYANTLGTLAFQFRAYYEDDAQPTVITEYNPQKGGTTIIRRIADQLVPLAKAAKTGDAAPIAVLVALLAAGVVLVVVSGKRRKGESK
jgi:hypothetical protein